MVLASLDGSNLDDQNQKTDPNSDLILGCEPKHCFTSCKVPFEIYSKYIPIKPVGKGSYGVVCAALNTETRQRIAIKKIHNVFEDRKKALMTLRELVILGRVGHHDNVIGLKDVMVSNSGLVGSGFVPDSKENFKDVYMVYELMDTDLHRLISSPQPLSQDHAKYFLYQLLRGLNYLHSANILHRDLKPGNLLVNTNCELKICDFGLARTTATDPHFLTDYIVTRWYRAPELLLGCDHRYGPSIDMWSVGCIFAEILGRTPLFPGTDSLNQIRLILATLGTQTQSNIGWVHNVRSRRFIDSLPYSRGTPFGLLFPQANPLAIDLLKKMLMFNPKKRITVSQALQHPYLANLYDPRKDVYFNFPMEVNFDDNTVGEKRIRELLWQQMLSYNPEEVCKQINYPKNQA